MRGGSGPGVRLKTAVKRGSHEQLIMIEVVTVVGRISVDGRIIGVIGASGAERVRDGVSS